MRVALKPIGEQVIVITGASSGIGLVTARMAAERGARVVLAARNERDLAGAVQAIRDAGGRAVAQVADVADPEQVEAIANTAVRSFGRIDTWVNNAGVALYGRSTDITLADMRRQFDVLYWGGVHGTRTAVAHLRAHGGAIITVASALADRAVPLQGSYCAAKHALKAFTDTVRMELEADGAPISVTLVKPASVDTPLFDKARTYMDVAPRPIPPVYVPDVVARTILRAAERPIREISAGGAGAMLPAAAAVAPALTDRYMVKRFFTKQRGQAPADDRPDNLYAVVPQDGGARGDRWRRHVRRSSVYTGARLHPARAALASAALGLAVLAGWRTLTRRA
ncbi:MAG TPA: SDR family oxidoreductase [Gemmatimonadaceae bacterium]|nr:SDR family oxidoreductase [Gemmatimonadaceae bacterium]